ncbi:MAG TPA: UvrD-helicase domain-containing protein [Verrucomicrobiae bacterium]|nr:UvrD-helicase domain-containing protein [Verrucomicrobiae bacterium]
MKLTSAQQRAIDARGNVLVVAGAGTGKTRTLVERCLDCLLEDQPRVSIDEVLMVTFTEAAAAEMRTRVRLRLEHEARTSKDPGRWLEQLALFETAHFGTLHSFCLQLVRQHFYELELDPQLVVLPEHEARLLANETLDDLLRAHYQGEQPLDEAVRQVVRAYGRGSDRSIRTLVLRIHHYAQTLPDPAGWLTAQLNCFSEAEPVAWRQWWSEAVAGLPGQWLATLQPLISSNGLAAKCASTLEAALAKPGDPGALLARIISARAECPPGKKGAWFDPIKTFFAEAEFLSALAPAPGRPDPIAQDWAWTRPHMIAVLKLCVEFGQAFAEVKREQAIVDFHDLEQYALRLLWDPATHGPTAIARSWREKLRFIFVDEYQDINAAQDRIIQSLAREEPHANRFLVGDVKQSIYRFRLANPRIFQNYADAWAQSPATVAPLVENFRSRQSVLDFVNSVFGLLMSRELGGADYARDAALLFGAPQDRVPLGTSACPGPAAELHLLLKGNDEQVQQDEDMSEQLAELNDLIDAEREARLVGHRLRELHRQRVPIWDVETGNFRPVEWKDIAILLRAPANKAESYAKEFARLGLPLQVDRPAFYKSSEVSDLLSLLQILDNPLQDLPLLAVLHSPLAGLTINELAEIRLAGLKTRFWTALLRWHRAPARDSGTLAPAVSGSSPGAGRAPALAKVSLFLQRFARWRRLARQVSLSRCLEIILAETHYAQWALTQPRGPQRHSNIQRLVALAQDFDHFQRQGLFRFLRFIDAQKEIDADPEVPASTGGNAVRLMSIHQSKGLEFPVVVVADLGKPFNTLDLASQIILDEEFGLCPLVRPPHTGKQYPSIGLWRARRRQLSELLGEELRLLYVALTRARDRVILAGSITRRKLDEVWFDASPVTRDTLTAARSCADWLGRWFSLNSGGIGVMTGQTNLFEWTIHELADLASDSSKAAGDDSAEPAALDFGSSGWPELRSRIAWQYPHTAATGMPAKTSVSALRRLAAEELEDEAATLFPQFRRRARSRGTITSSELTATEVGRANHLFLQLLSPAQGDSAEALKEQARLMLKQGLLTPEQAAAIDFEGIAHFWRGPLGRQISCRADRMHRELAFTVRLSNSELAGIVDCPEVPALDGEFTLVQGVADLVVIERDELWLVDFKTDQIKPDDIEERVKLYAPQVGLYAAALSRIYKRPISQACLYFLGLRKAVPVKRAVSG